MHWFYYFFIFMTSTAYALEIMTTNNFSDIAKECTILTTDCLVLFDVDATLIVPNDAILKPNAKKYFEVLIADYEDRDLFREIRMQASHSIVDNRSVDFIRQLQQCKIPVIAFTAAPAKINDSDSIGDWRVKELKRFGFDFQTTFPSNTYLILPKSHFYQHFPIFKSGVLYSSFHPKGDVLVTFLQYLNFNPEKVVFIDDELKHVESVVTCLDHLGIPCLGIHYTAANETHYELNVELARFQIDYFVKNNKWLSDKEGMNIYFK